MKYISICSGIEAASVAWRPLGWDAIAFAEIEPFPNAVLAHHFPNVPNLGDICRVDWREYYEAVDLIVGGTPCQSFSVAGTRTGMDGASGLVREYFRLLSQCKPKWFVWENVPGVLSCITRGKSDFSFIMSQWHKLGYNVSYRILDARYFGVPQRRRRLFAVGHLADWRYPAKVLFEWDSLQGHFAPGREKRNKDTTRIEEYAYTASEHGGYKKGVGMLRASGGDLGGGSETLIAKCLTVNNARYNIETETFVSNSSFLRRLTPLECERLQGFPDGYTDILFRGKPATDGARYKALGNSMCVNVMRWIGERIQAVEDGKL